MEWLIVGLVIALGFWRYKVYVRKQREGRKLWRDANTFIQRIEKHRTDKRVSDAKTNNS